MENKNKIIIILVILLVGLVSYMINDNIKTKYENKIQKITSNATTQGYNQGQANIILTINTEFTLPSLTNRTGNLTVEWIPICSNEIKSFCGW